MEFQTSVNQVSAISNDIGMSSDYSSGVSESVSENKSLLMKLLQRKATAEELQMLTPEQQKYLKKYYLLKSKLNTVADNSNERSELVSQIQLLQTRLMNMRFYTEEAEPKEDSQPKRQPENKDSTQSQPKQLNQSSTQDFSEGLNLLK